MTNPLSSEARPPMLVTGKRLNDVLDSRDEAMIDAFDKFKLEVVQRQESLERMQQEMQTIIVQAMGVIKLNNMLQPSAESVEARYFVERQGFRYEVSQQVAADAAARGGVAFRETSILERYEADPGKIREAESVVAQLRSVAA